MSLAGRLSQVRSGQAAQLLDAVLATLLTAGALVQVPGGEERLTTAAALICAGLTTTSVAWRRRAPASAAGVAIAALLVYQLISRDSQLTFEPYAVLLTYYSLGRRAEAGYRRSVVGGLLVAVLVAFTIVFIHVKQGSLVNIGSAWLLFGVLPCVGGALITRRAALSTELAARTLRLKDEQELHAAARAEAERTRIARDLHDVIAHCVSVMVIQAAGARIVARRDVAAARDALHVVEASGREAMADLRRIMGVLRRDPDEPATPPMGLAQLDGLVAQTRAAGLRTELVVVGAAVALSPDLDLAAYRIVQEALTNTVKHAGPARILVTVTFDVDTLELRVVDDGRRAMRTSVQSGGGHGLTGMHERVAQYGGSLRAAHQTEGGYEVCARLPLAPTAAAGPDNAADGHASRLDEPTDRPPPRWLDATFVGFWLMALEVEAVTSRHRHGSLILNVLVVGVSAVALFWRREHPWGFLIVVGSGAFLLRNGLTSGDYATLTGLYGVLIPPYAVATWLPRRQAAMAMSIWVIATIGISINDGAALSGTVGPLLAATVACTAGVVMRSQRELMTSLRHTSRRLVAEQADRESLAVAGERARITRGLHAVVARGVTTMVIQAEVAGSLLEPTASPSPDVSRALDALASIETSGREVLAQLRRILGVLRHGDAALELSPQPGLDQIYLLIERSRERREPVDFRIEGEPGTLVAGVDLVTYRILEEVLSEPRQPSGPPVGIVLRFGADELELEVDLAVDDARTWPTTTILDRVNLFHGEVCMLPHDANIRRLLIRIPRQMQGVLT